MGKAGAAEKKVAIFYISVMNTLIRKVILVDVLVDESTEENVCQL